jgi:hypothetical protein
MDIKFGRKTFLEYDYLERLRGWKDLGETNGAVPSEQL